MGGNGSSPVYNPLFQEHGTAAIRAAAGFRIPIVHRQ
jgi:hypothetical protein